LVTLVSGNIQNQISKSFNIADDAQIVHECAIILKNIITETNLISL